MSPLHAFLLGALSMASLTAALFFLRFWRLSADRIFLFLAAAFSILTIDWAALALIAPGDGARHYVFVVRLAAFALIIVGIVDKNRKPPAA